jgi:hypothetical protein
MGFTSNKNWLVRSQFLLLILGKREARIALMIILIETGISARQD